ncbi:MAG TPA: prepilin peptidase [Longimicrobiales bacterium]|nr:prepilin peptidase [Longimicrobiales bacterium]
MSVEPALAAPIAGLFGLLIGSFLNVCSLRWPQDESVVSPPSHCPRCGEAVRWYDNVPVVSWLVLRGRCRWCRGPISVQYPLVELATGLVWAGVFAAHGASGEALRGSLFLTLLFGIALSDARFYIIPDEFSLGGTVLGLALSWLPGGLDPLESALGVAVGYGALWLVAVGGTWLIRRLFPGRLEEAGVDRAMGGGDVKMMAMVGAFVGIWGVVETIFIGSVLALLVYGPVASLSKRLIPLGVFLAAAGAVAWAWGEAMMRWYLTQVVGLPM